MTPIQSPVGADEGQQSSLSTKISVVVFWGMIITGMVASFLLLRGLDRETTNLYSANSSQFINELEQFVSHDGNFSWESFERFAQTRYPTYGIEGVIIESDDRKLLIGKQGGPLLPLSRKFSYHTGKGPQMQHGVVRLTMNFIPLGQAVSEKRKDVLLFMGITLLAFGFFLHKALQKILSLPFQRMVQTARSITLGKMGLRFTEENRNDEFGYLARFINEALDFVTLKQQELEQALGKVRQSQAELVIEKTRVEVTLHSIGDAVVTTDANGNIDYMNPVAEQLAGQTLAVLRGKSARENLQLLNDDTRKPVECAVTACLRSGSMVGPVDHVVLVRPDGSEVDVVNSASPIREESGRLLGAVLVFHDVGKSRKLAKQLSYQASHDELTKLYNRREFERRLENAMISSAGDNIEHVLCFMDMDQFKIVNDTCGHAAGDELLRQFSAILRSKVRDTDALARLGGDEFGILYERCTMEDAKRIVDSLLGKVRDFRFEWQGHNFEVGVSVGLVSITPSDENLSEILSAADVACYAAKDAGRNRMHVYQKDDFELKQRHGETRWVTRIRKALEENRFCLYSQPIVMVSGKKEISRHYEVLMRLLDEEGKLVPPLAFIPAAERYHMMPAIDQWVVRHTFDLMASHEVELKDVVFSINLSGQSIGDEGFLEFVIGAFRESGVSAKHICFEITETAAVANIGRARIFMATLRGMGCRFSLDDFGSGMSSFSYLQSLKVDFLKIDGGFVKNMCREPVNRAIVESANQIGHAMGMQTVAEFVEDGEILKALGVIGVDFAQGYGIAKPCPIEELFQKNDADRKMSER
ncbi:MAG: EAL domain-containing protein [Pseudomonadota bacterium]